MTGEPALQGRPASLTGRQIGWLAVLFGVLTPHSQHRKSLPEDSAVYTYIGWAWQHGLRPYLELWDHKGPLLYLIERLGAMILPVPGLGVDLLDFLGTVFAAAVLLWIGSRLVGRRALLVLGVGSLFFCAAYARGGNMTETWAVPFLAAAHWAAWRAATGTRAAGSRTARPWWLGAVVGAASAAIFWIRPNMMVFAGLAAVYLVWRTAREDGAGAAAVQLGSGLAGFAAMTGVSLLPYAADGALPALKAAYFGYNTAYSAFITHAERVATLRSFVFELATMPLYVAALCGWGLLAWSLLRPGVRIPAQIQVPRDYRVLLLVSGLIEFAAIQLSGRSYVHYLYTLWPTAFVLAALAVHACLPAREAEGLPRSLPEGKLVWLAVLLVVPAGLLRYAVDMTGQGNPRTELAVVRVIDQVTGPEDRIAILGGPDAAYIYLHSRRFATSPYFYTLPITHKAFPHADEVRAEYARELIAAPPKVIAGNTISQTLCQVRAECVAASNFAEDEEGYFAGDLPLKLQPLLAAQYREVTRPEDGFWKVYVRNDVAAAHRLGVNLP